MGESREQVREWIFVSLCSLAVTISGLGAAPMVRDENVIIKQSQAKEVNPLTTHCECRGRSWECRLQSGSIPLAVVIIRTVTSGYSARCSRLCVPDNWITRYTHQILSPKSLHGQVYQDSSTSSLSLSLSQAVTRMWSHELKTAHLPAA